MDQELLHYTMKAALFSSPEGHVTAELGFQEKSANPIMDAIAKWKLGDQMSKYKDQAADAWKGLSSNPAAQYALYGAGAGAGAGLLSSMSAPKKERHTLNSMLTGALGGAALGGGSRILYDNWGNITGKTPVINPKSDPIRETRKALADLPYKPSASAMTPKEITTDPLTAQKAKEFTDWFNGLQKMPEDQKLQQLDFLSNSQDPGKQLMHEAYHDAVEKLRKIHMNRVLIGGELGGVAGAVGTMGKGMAKDMGTRLGGGYEARNTPLSEAVSRIIGEGALDKSPLGKFNIPEVEANSKVTPPIKYQPPRNPLRESLDAMDPVSQQEIATDSDPGFVRRIGKAVMGRGPVEKPFTTSYTPPPPPAWRRALSSVMSGRSIKKPTGPVNYPLLRDIRGLNNESVTHEDLRRIKNFPPKEEPMSVGRVAKGVKNFGTNTVIGGLAGAAATYGGEYARTHEMGPWAPGGMWYESPGGVAMHDHPGLAPSITPTLNGQEVAP